MRQAEQTERARIEADRDADIARIQAEAEERIRQADAEVERVKQQQYVTEAQRDMAIAETQRRAEEYKAMIAALTSEKIAGIDSNAQTQITALQEQSKIAIAGILETGKTERWRIGWGWGFTTVLVVVVAVVVLALRRRQTQAGEFLPPSKQLPVNYPRIEVRSARQNAERY
ncbi:MAG: hypothetical protein R3C14_22690 [Caldilineaceae bacterium]